MAEPGKAAQIERFRATARALGCDEDKEKFEATLGKIAAHKPNKEMVNAKAENTNRKGRRSGGRNTD
jgi:hypothetical protein